MVQGDRGGIEIGVNAGYVEKAGKDWYLIKDSGSGSRNNSHPGYYFSHEDYVKLKMLGVMMPKSAIPTLVAKPPNEFRPLALFLDTSKHANG